MTKTIKIAVEPRGANHTLEPGDDIADAPLHQREAMIDRLCQAILTESGSLRAGDPG